MRNLTERLGGSAALERRLDDTIEVCTNRRVYHVLYSDVFSHIMGKVHWPVAQQINMAIVMQLMELNCTRLTGANSD